MFFGPSACSRMLALQPTTRASAEVGTPRADLDLALTVLRVASGMPAPAGGTAFATARAAGWIADVLEERYVGARPPQPLPR